MLAEDILVVVNEDGRTQTQTQSSNGVLYITRENSGMNIGSWDAGFRAYPDYDCYVFLQDECVIEQHDFLQVYTQAFASDGQLGMLGESINPKWTADWLSLQRSGMNVFVPGHEIDGNPAPRVDCYLHHMRRWGIEPGPVATHLRSLIWCFRGETITLLGGFPIGHNKGECIAAEIGVSRKVEELGYTFRQISEQPFSYIYHTEWRRDGRSKLA